MLFRSMEDVTVTEAVPAIGDIPVIDDSKDFSKKWKPTYTYEGDYIIITYEPTDKEIELGEKLQQWHLHSKEKAKDSDLTTQHFNLTPHFHSIRNARDGSPTYWVWRPSSIWTRNNMWPNSADWPTVSWTTSQSTTASVEVSTSVGVTNSVVSAEIGTSFTSSHTIGTSITRTFKVPYKMDGRVKVNYYRPYKTFTCVTTYSLLGNYWVETGPGSAQGKPYDMVCSLETRYY